LTAKVLDDTVLDVE